MGKRTDMSVNFRKVYRANNSNDKQQAPTAVSASSVTLMHSNFKTFKSEHPLATASTPLSKTNSESSERLSRDLQCNPTASSETSLIFGQAAIPRDFNDFPTPRANKTTASSVKPSQNRRLTSSIPLQHCPIASRPGSPT